MHNRRDLAILFDGTFEGFLTIIYERYYNKLEPDFISEDSAPFYLEQIYVETDLIKADRVFNGLKKKSLQSAEYLYYAFLCDAPCKYMDLFNYTVLVFTIPKSADLYDNLDYVLNVHKMARKVKGEAHSYLGFLRFAETKTGIFYADFAPANNVLPLICPHFRDRFNNAKWMIEDKHYRQAALFDGTSFVIVEIDAVNTIKVPEYSETEGKYQHLWKKFVDTIAVEDRISNKRQNNMIPKHHRKYMIEFRVLKS